MENENNTAQNGAKLTVEQQIWQWLDDVVIGLNLCPFAKKPRVNQQIRLKVCDARKDKAVIKEFSQELDLLIATPAQQMDTTMLVLSNHCYDFYDYLDVLDKCQLQIQQRGLEGEYQLASFHPEYLFDGTEPDDRENYTNRAPYPIIHILREDSMTKAVSKFPNPESIPGNNIHTLETLPELKFQRLFGDSCK